MARRMLSDGSEIVGNVTEYISYKGNTYPVVKIKGLHGIRNAICLGDGFQDIADLSVLEGKGYILHE